MSAAEEWRAIPTAPGYEASTLGRIRRGSRVLSQRPHPRGYVVVDVSIAGKAKTRTVHRLVAETFLGDGAGRQVNHKNGVKTDNRDVNLEWATARENTAHAFAEGLRVAPARDADGRFSPTPSVSP